MIKFIKQLILGHTPIQRPIGESTLKHRTANIKAIWNNDHEDDSGLEKLFRLFLAVSQFLFLGIYLKHIMSRIMPLWQDFAIDIFVLFKALFPVLILYNGWYHNEWVIYLLYWFLFETMLYIPTLIFASDLLSQPRSYRRSFLLMSINYLEIIFGFGVFYTMSACMNKPFAHWFDGIYFSFITMGSIGFGDYYPVTTYGKFLVSLQSIIFFIFVVVSLNFMTNRIQTKGYFSSQPN